MAAAHDSSFMPIIHWFQQSPIKLTEKDSIYVEELAGWLDIDYEGGEETYSGVWKDDNFVLFRQTGPDPDKRSSSESDPRLEKPCAESDDIRPTIEVRGRKFYLAKIHLHNGTEHDTQGIPDHPTEPPRSFEIHLLHETFDADYLAPKVVLAVYAVEAAAHKKAATPEGYNRLLSGYQQGKKAGPEIQINPADLLGWVGHPEDSFKKSQQFYHYEGSLTSPPYIETVSWYVFPHLVPVHTGAFKKIETHAHQAQRPVFGIDRRFILRSFKQGSLPVVETAVAETAAVKPTKRRAPKGQQ